MTSPVASIVIPVLNQVHFIRDCLDSVRMAKEALPVEVLVRDGGSNDGTLAIYEEYPDVISDLSVGPDGGQAAAIDAGLRAGKGRLLTWLNGDDVLLPGALARLARAIVDAPRAPWFIGGTLLLDVEGHVTRAVSPPPLLPAKWAQYVSVYGPSSFFEADLYEQIGGIDFGFRLAMDTDLWYRMVQRGARYQVVPGYLWGFREHPGSKTTAQLFERPEATMNGQMGQDLEFHEMLLRYGRNGSTYGDRIALAATRLQRIVTGRAAAQVRDGKRWQGREWRQVPGDIAP